MTLDEAEKLTGAKVSVTDFDHWSEDGELFVFTQFDFEWPGLRQSLVMTKKSANLGTAATKVAEWKTGLIQN